MSVELLQDLTDRHFERPEMVVEDSIDEVGLGPEVLVSHSIS